MDMRDFNELGGQIKSVVQDAIDSMNFEQLNKNINRTINDTMDSIRSGMPGGNKSAYNGRQDGQKSSGAQGRPFYYRPKDMYNRSSFSGPNAGCKTDTEVGFPVLKNPPGRVSSVLMIVFGYLGLSLTGITMLVMIILTAALKGFVTVGTAITSGLAPLFILSLVFAVIGTKKHGRLKRFRTYVQTLGRRTFCTLKELAGRVGKSKTFVYKDVLRMIQTGYFPEGHVDEQKTCLMVTNGIYQQYLIAQQGMKERASGRASEEQKDTKQAGTASDSEFQKVIADGRAYMKNIREANEAIPDPEISNKLYRMELIIQKIFDYVQQHPEQISQLRRFIDYYMPTTDKLVAAYKEFDMQPIQGENIKNAKAEISKALDTINSAYEKLYDSMYEEAAMDVSSDIVVLQTLLAQEGLTNDELKSKTHKLKI